MGIHDLLIRIVIMFIFSLLIGYNREQKDSPAGIRTHLIVGMSATFVGLLQNYLMVDHNINETRLLASVITGVGFLGSGALSSNRKYVKGLASAATVWAIACIGVIVGSGYILIGTIGFIIILLSLMIVKKIVFPYEEKRIEVKLSEFKHSQQGLKDFFAMQDVFATPINLKMQRVEDVKFYYAVFLVRYPKSKDSIELFSLLSHLPFVLEYDIYDI